MNPETRPFSTLRRCGAKTRRGTACQCPAMKNGRCRLHGGKSTGPRTPEGLERSRRARWKHGRYSREAKEAAREARWSDPVYVEARRQADKRRIEREMDREQWRARRRLKTAQREFEEWLRQSRIALRAPKD